MVTLFILVQEQFSYILTNCCQRKAKLFYVTFINHDTNLHF